MQYRFKSNRSAFNRKNAALKDMIQGRMAADIEANLKIKAGMPVKTGAMKSETRHFRNPNGGFRVEIDKAYAAYQERGMRADGTHRVRHYSTSGTKAGFFRRAIDMVLRNRDSYVKQASEAVNI